MMICMRGTVADVDLNIVSSPVHAAQANDFSPDHAIGATSSNRDPFVSPTKFLVSLISFDLCFLLRNLDSLPIAV